MKRSHIVILTAILLCLFTLAACQTDSSDTQDTTAIHTQNITEITETTEPAETTAAITTPVPTELTEEQKSLIDRNLDIIASSVTGDSYYMPDIIAENRDIFNEIVKIGPPAIPYLRQIGENLFNGNTQFTYIRRGIALQAVYDIDRTVYDMTIPSPTGELTLRLHVSRFNSSPQNMYNEGIATFGTYLTDTKKHTIASSSTKICNPSAEWSPDAQTAVITSRRYDDETLLFLNADGRRVLTCDTVIDLIEGQYPDPNLRYHSDFEILAWNDDGSISIAMQTYGEQPNPLALRITFRYQPDGSLTDLSCEETPLSWSEYEAITDPPMSETEIGMQVGYILFGDYSDTTIENKIQSLLWDVRIINQSLYTNFIESYPYYIKPDAYRILIGLGDTAVPTLLKFAESQEHEESDLRLKTMFLASKLDPTVYPDLRTAPQNNCLFVPTNTKSLLFDLDRDRILDCRYMPFIDELEARFGINIRVIYNEILQMQILSWESDTAVRFGFTVQSGISDIGEITGEFVYDLATDTQLSLSYETEYVPDLGPEPYDAMTEDIAEQLYRMSLHYQKYYAVNKDALAAIAALGEDALPYLQSVIENSPSHMGYKILSARQAVYAIKPSLYDLEFYSPGGTKKIFFSVSEIFPFKTSLQYNYPILIDLLTGEETELVREEDYNSGFLNPVVTFSPDGRYVLIHNSGEDIGAGDPIIADTRTGEVFTLKLDLFLAFYRMYPNQSFDISNLSLTQRAWDPSGTLYLDFELPTARGDTWIDEEWSYYYNGLVRGWYSVNLKDGTPYGPIVEEYIAPTKRK